MNKTELTERIIDRITDPWSESPEDFADLEPITLEQAQEYLEMYRAEDEDLEEDSKLPAECTAEILMEVENCYIASMKFEFRVRQLTDWLTDNEPVAFYDQCFADYVETAESVVRKVLPTEFLKDTMTLPEFPFYLGEDTGHDPSAADLIVIGQHSSEFNISDTYCYYDDKHDAFVSTNTPFADGVIDAHDFAEFILMDAGALGELLDNEMDDDDIRTVFGCTKEELIHED